MKKLLLLFVLLLGSMGLSAQVLERVAVWDIPLGIDKATAMERAKARGTMIADNGDNAVYTTTQVLEGLRPNRFVLAFYNGKLMAITVSFADETALRPLAQLMRERYGNPYFYDEEIAKGLWKIGGKKKNEVLSIIGVTPRQGAVGYTASLEYSHMPLLEAYYKEHGEKK